MISCTLATSTPKTKWRRPWTPRNFQIPVVQWLLTNCQNNETGPEIIPMYMPSNIQTSVNHNKVVTCMTPSTKAATDDIKCLTQTSYLVMLQHLPFNNIGGRENTSNYISVSYFNNLLYWYHTFIHFRRQNSYQWNNTTRSSRFPRIYYIPARLNSCKGKGTHTYTF